MTEDSKMKIEAGNFLCDARKPTESRCGYEARKAVWEGELGFQEREDLKYLFWKMS